MSKEPMNLVFEQLKLLRKDVHALKDGQDEVRSGLRDVKTTLSEHGLTLAQHTLQLDFLGERVEKLREGTLTAIGFATETGTRTRTVERQLADLSKRVETLEKSK